MQSHPERDDDPQPEAGRRGRLVGVVVAVIVVIVILHLTGVLGPSTHR